MKRPRPHQHVGHNAAHMFYALTCDEFDQLALRAEGRCERCGSEMQKPVIDHDHEIGRWAVRGLVCNQCNIILCKIDRCERDEDEASLAYFRSAFHLGLRSHTPGYRPATPAFVDMPRPRRDQHITRKTPLTDLTDIAGAARILGLDAERVAELAAQGRLIGRGREGKWVFRVAVVQRLAVRLARVDSLEPAA